MTLLSIVVPIRNMSGRLDPLYLWVQSALKANCEVILIHDFLEPATENEILEFQNKIANRKLIFRSGVFNSPGLARNEGLAIASGEFVAFWDSDDVPDVANFIHMTNQCKARECDIGIGSFGTQVENNKALRKYEIGLQDTLNKVAIYPGLWRMVFKRSKLEGVHFSELLLAEDQLFLACFFQEDRRIYFAQESVYSYVVAQLGGLTTSRRNIEDLCEAIERIRTLNQNKNLVANPVFSRTLIIRISLTLLKLGTFTQKLFSLGLLTKIFFTHLPSSVRIWYEVAKFKHAERQL
jgi:glycosyltransferase involved in cell wall biosynthesis